LNAYISFHGNAEEAINFYRDNLGAKVEHVSRYDGAMQVEDDWKQKILHSTLTIGGGSKLMISDSLKETSVTSNISLSLNYHNAEEIMDKFNKMAEGGTVTMPLNETFFSPKFGILKDKFGVTWMFHLEGFI